MTSVLIHTLGCSANTGESEIMGGILSEEGYIIVDDLKIADIVIINICTVKGDDTALKAIRKFNEHNNKKMVIAGCIPPARSNIFKNASPDAALISTDNLSKIADAVKSVENNTPVSYLGRNYEDKAGLNKFRTNREIGIITINNSCNDACSFCGVKLIKGKLKSYPSEKIISEAKKALFEGCKELWITSQDTAAYGIDISGKSMLPELVNELVQIPGDFKIRIGMFNPMNISDMEDEFVSMFSDSKVYKFAHIPLQSGSNEVLKRMKRRYSREYFMRLINKLKENYSGMTFATDVIVGFPGECDNDFNDTVQCLNEFLPEVLHISKYQRIPNTIASVMKDQVDGKTAMKRSKILSEIHPVWSKNRLNKFNGEEYECYVTDKKKDYIAHSDSYVQIIIPSAQDLLGKKVRVKINDAAKYYLIGELIDIIEEKASIIIKV